MAGGFAVAGGMVIAGVLFHLARGTSFGGTEPVLHFGSRIALAFGGGAFAGALGCGVSATIVGSGKRFEMLMASAALGVVAAITLWRGFHG
jgi:hypothetical protein